MHIKIGNIVKFITTITGIALLVKLLWKDCGCDKRQEDWNNLKFRK